MTALFFRIAAALVGSYALAAWSSIAILALPVDRPQAVIAGTLASFFIYSCGVLWSFIASTPIRAWLGLFACGLILAPGVWLAAVKNL